MITLSTFIALFIFYGIGWVGAFMLLMTCSYVFSTIYHELKLENPANVSTPWRSFVVSMYEKIDIDFYDEVLSEYCLSFETITIMAILACLGPLLFTPAFIIMCVAWVIIYLWITLR